MVRKLQFTKVTNKRKEERRSNQLLANVGSQKGPTQKGPATRDQDPKGTRAKRDQGHCQDQRNISVPSGFFF